MNTQQKLLLEVSIIRMNLYLNDEASKMNDLRKTETAVISHLQHNQNMYFQFMRYRQMLLFFTLGIVTGMLLVHFSFEGALNTIYTIATNIISEIISQVILKILKLT